MPIAVADVVVGPGDRPSPRDPEDPLRRLALTDLFDLIPPTAHMERSRRRTSPASRLSFPGGRLMAPRRWSLQRLGPGDRLSSRCVSTTHAGTLCSQAVHRNPDPARFLVHRVANEIVYTFTGVRGVFGTEIAFTARTGKSRGRNLHRGMDGQDLRKVTDTGASTSPAGPRGQWLAYTSFRTGRPIVYLRNVSPGRRRRSSRFGGSKAPGGSRPTGCAYGREPAAIPTSTGPGGRRPRKRCGRVGARGLPSPSPDGRRIAFVSDRAVPADLRQDDRRRRKTRISNGRATRRRLLSPGETGIATPSGPRTVIVVTPHPTDPETREVASGRTDGDCRGPVFPRRPLPGLHLRKRDYSALKIISVGRPDTDMFRLGSWFTRWSPDDSLQALSARMHPQKGGKENKGTFLGMGRAGVVVGGAGVVGCAKNDGEGRKDRGAGLRHRARPGRVTPGKSAALRASPPGCSRGGAPESRYPRRSFRMTTSGYFRQVGGERGRPQNVGVVADY